MTNHSEVETARQQLVEDADPKLVKAIEKALEAGTHEWHLDPQVRGVVGLIRTGEPNRADVIVYVTDRDFEVDNEFF